MSEKIIIDRMTIAIACNSTFIQRNLATTDFVTEREPHQLSGITDCLIFDVFYVYVKKFTCFYLSQLSLSFTQLNDKFLPLIQLSSNFLNTKMFHTFDRTTLQAIKGEKRRFKIVAR